jgi:signal transduction histidine kinase
MSVDEGSPPPRAVAEERPAPVDAPAPPSAAPEDGRLAPAASAFVALATHELRTPLQALGLHVDMMHSRVAQAADDVPTPWLLDRLERTRALVRRANRLVDDLLSACELAEGHGRLDRETFDLAQLAEDVVAANAESLHWARCPHLVERSGPVVGRWDRSRVERVLENLLSNAMKYAAGCAIEVRVWAAGGDAYLSVKDAGPGIAEGDRDVIFERFRRGTRTGGVSGSGLGLWIVRTIAEAHGGSVGVESAPGRGATFTVRLPPSEAAA